MNERNVLKHAAANTVRNIINQHCECPGEKMPVLICKSNSRSRSVISQFGEPSWEGFGTNVSNLSRVHIIEFIECEHCMDLSPSYEMLGQAVVQLYQSKLT